MMRQKTAFVERRTAEMVHEQNWVKDGVPLPKTQKTPPEWVVIAIRLFWETSLKPLVDLDPKKEGNLTYANLVAMLGMVNAQVAFLSNPEKALEGIPDPEAKEQLRSLAPRMFAQQKQAIRKLEAMVRKIQESGRPATLDEQVSNLNSFQEGMTGLIDTKGEFVKGRSARANILKAVWFYCKRPPCHLLDGGMRRDAS